MKKYSFFIFLMFSLSFFSQKKVIKKIETQSEEINIYTAGLDTIMLENSTSGFVEVYLNAEDYDDQLIKIDESSNSAKISFEFKGTQTREVVFRKFITKRLQRANAIVKIPKNKDVFIFGENVDIESKDFKNDLAIYIENGIVKLNEIKANTILKLYSGNVFASTKNTNLELKTKSGKIEVDGIQKSKTYKKDFKKNNHKLKVSSAKSNIFLTKD